MLRDEYPRYNLIRPSWQSLNGVWQCEVADFSDKDAVYYLSQELSGNIVVPFSAGSKISEFASYAPIKSIWCKRTFSVQKSQLGGVILLNFGAVDYCAEVYVNGTLATVHKGGYTPFSVDISALCHEGSNFLVVNAKDDTEDMTIPCGFQYKVHSKNCHPQVVGIWQSVWLEFTSRNYVLDVRPTAIVEKQTIMLEGNIVGDCDGYIMVKITQNNQVVANYRFVQKNHYLLTCPIKTQLKLWNILDANIYNVEFLLYSKSGVLQDKIHTYTAFRTIKFVENKLMLNNTHTIIRAIKTTSFYKDSYYTAHSAGTIKQELVNAVSLGYNAIIPTQKIAEPLFLSLCDKLGIMVISNFPTEHLDHKSSASKLAVHTEWLAVLARDYGHPCIVVWNPISSGSYDGDLNYNLMMETKTRDPNRLFMDNSNGLQFNTEIYAKTISATNRNDFLAHVFTPYNGTFLDDKAEAKLYASNNKLLSRTALKQLPLFVSFGKGMLAQKLTPETEIEFLNMYEYMVAAIVSANGCGFAFDMLFDTGNMQWGVYNENMECKLSKKGKNEFQRINSLYFNKT